MAAPAVLSCATRVVLRRRHCIMSGDTLPLDQKIYAKRVWVETESRHGKRIISTCDIRANDQVLWVVRPLILALETSQLDSTCYSCLRPEDTHVLNKDLEEGSIALKRCTGCKTVSFCNKTCQKHAWKAYHKYECGIFARLQPRVLPSTVRAVMRIVLQRENGLVHDQEWDHLMQAESHMEDLSKAGGRRWEDISLMAKAVQAYSGTEGAIDLLVQLCCILMVNSFTLTTSMYDPVGIVLHPLPALMNHSCEPNAYVRFDSLDTQHLSGDKDPYGPPKVLRGSIWVHALRPIKKGEEICISYIDATVDVSGRQDELSSRYFFRCDCARCVADLAGPPMQALPSQAVSDAVRVLNASFKDRTAPDNLPLIRQALHDLTSSGRSIASYPSAQLRHQLVLGLIAEGEFLEAMHQNMILSFQIEPVLYERWYHPSRLVSMWRLFRLIQVCLPRAKTEQESKHYSVLACSLLQEMIFKTSFLYGPNSQMGELEEAIQSSKGRSGNDLIDVGATFFDQSRYGTNNCWGLLEYAMKNALDAMAGGPGAALWHAFSRDEDGTMASEAFAVSSDIMDLLLEKELGTSYSTISQMPNPSIKIPEPPPGYTAASLYARHVGAAVSTLASTRLEGRRALSEQSAAL
jgi:hypothetical protein